MHEGLLYGLSDMSLSDNIFLSSETGFNMLLIGEAWFMPTIQCSKDVSLDKKVQTVAKALYKWTSMCHRRHMQIKRRARRKAFPEDFEFVCDILVCKVMA